MQRKHDYCVKGCDAHRHCVCRLLWCALQQHEMQLFVEWLQCACMSTA